MRGRIGVAFLACACAGALAAVALLARPGGAGGRGEAAATRATRATATMMARFAAQLGVRGGTDGDYAHAWPLSQALAAALAVAALPDRTSADLARVRRLVGELDRYRDGAAYDSTALPPLGDGGTQYYDDNEWIGLDLLSAYRLLGDRTLLTRAERLFGFLASGWDGDRVDACPGGVFWANTPSIRVRNTVSTANAALLAVRLYRQTHDRRYLGWGRRMYGWVETCLAAPDGLLYDHLDRRGRITTDTWSYNQGAMIATATLLARATGDSRYLDRAESLARTALAHYRASRYRGEPAIFVAIFFRDLARLDRIRPHAEYRGALVRYVRRHVPLGTRGRFGRTLLDQSAAAQLYAEAAV